LFRPKSEHRKLSFEEAGKSMTKYVDENRFPIAWKTYPGSRSLVALCPDAAEVRLARMRAALGARRMDVLRQDLRALPQVLRARARERGSALGK
jgi:hypothetical protein